MASQVSAVAGQVINVGRVRFLAVLLIIIPAGLSAQGRGGMAARSAGGAPAAGASGAVHSAAMPSARPLGHGPSSPGNHLILSRSANGQVTLRRAPTPGGAHFSNRGRTIGTTTRGGQLTRSNSVPGLGFDYSHVAATRPNRLDGRHRRNDGAVLFPFFGGGGYFLPTGTDAVADAQGEGQFVEDAEEEDSAPGDRRARILSVDRISPAPDLGPPAPQRDVPEYVFVRRDGTVFFAVAYTWEKGSLRYVSNEGLRRSVARDTLDLDATQQFNEQRGMTFRAPA